MVTRAYSFLAVLFGYLILLIVQHRMNLSITKSQKNECTFDVNISQYQSILNYIFANDKESFEKRCVRFCCEDESKCGESEIKEAFNETLQYLNFEILTGRPNCTKLKFIGIDRTWKLIEVLLV